MNSELIATWRDIERECKVIVNNIIKYYTEWWHIGFGFFVVESFLKYVSKCLNFSEVLLETDKTVKKCILFSVNSEQSKIKLKLNVNRN